MEKVTAVETQEATYQIWVELKTNLHRFITRRSGNEADADDILQDVFFKIHSNIDRLRDTTKIHSWVYQITRNAIIDHYRKRRSDLSLDAMPDAFDVIKEDTEDAIDRAEIIACLSPMIDRLPDDYRQALVMADVEGITQANLANEMKLSLSGAKSRVQRARGKMKTMLLNCCQFQFDRLGRAVSMDRGNCGSGCGPGKC